MKRKSRASPRVESHDLLLSDYQAIVIEHLTIAPQGGKRIDVNTSFV